MLRRNIIKKSLIFYFFLLSITLIFLISCKTTIQEDNQKETTSEEHEEEIIEEETEEETIEGEEGTVEKEFEFNNAVKTPHWVENVPASNSIIPGVPINIIINFNFDLYEDSKIIIEKDGVQYNTGDTSIDENKLALRSGMDPEAPDGLYKVSYTACWPDGSCHDGSFEFAIDSKLSEEYTDLRGSEEITINMENISFDMPQIIINAGTSVTWINLEDAGHYINTDPHPGHNYYPEQNSKLLSKGDSYSLTFDKPGFYPYHCSTHYPAMQGVIIVK